MLKDTKYIKDLRARDFKSSGVVVNDCFRPSAGASKADLVEYHREEMGLRGRRQRTRQSDYNKQAWYRRYGNPEQSTQEREIARRLRQSV